MNNVSLMGRITKELEVRYSNTQKGEQLAVVRFTVAVNRRTKNDEADFISCVAFGKIAEVMGKYLHKGSQIGISGHIQTGSYTNKEGQKVYTTDVIVDQMDFADSKSQGSSSSQFPEASDEGFMSIPDDIGDDLPFK